MYLLTVLKLASGIVVARMVDAAGWSDGVLEDVEVVGMGIFPVRPFRCTSLFPLLR